MNTWIRRLTPLLVVAFVAGLVAARPVAATTPDTGAVPDPLAVSLPTGLNPDAVLDAQESAEVAEITERITPYLYVGDDGLVRLIEGVTAADLEVSEEYLANFKAAMEYSNQNIARGDMKVAPDMRTTLTAKALPRGVVGIDPRRPSPLASGPSLAVDGAQPDWGGWDYGQGAMFYSSYGDWTYYRYNYYPLCNGMAAYLNRPWMSSSLCYFWGYNQSYFSNYCYNPGGTYYYLPYGYMCNYSCQQRPTCGCQPNYKPLYFWVRTYYYYPSCGCYQYTWSWQLLYGRY